MMTLPTHAYLNGEVRLYGDSRVGLLTHALNYGTAVFGGLRGYWNAEEEELFVFRPADHFERFRDSASLLRMNLSETVDGLREGLRHLIRAEGLRTDCYIRPLAFVSDEVIGVRLHGLRAATAMVALPFGKYIAREGGIHVTFSSWTRVDDNVIPPRGKISGAYANSSLVKSDAELAGFDEALVLNRAGQLCEGSAENIFVVRRGVAFTPPVTGSILEGVTRRTVMTLLRDELGVSVEERPIDRTEVYLADELLLVGTGAEITPATRVDHRTIGRGEIGPVGQELARLFGEVVRGRVPRYRNWCEGMYRSSNRSRQASEGALHEADA